MNEVIIILDYYCQQLEAGCNAREAADRTHSFMYNKFRETMKRDEYLATYDLVTRLSWR